MIPLLAAVTLAITLVLCSLPWTAEGRAKASRHHLAFRVTYPDGRRTMQIGYEEARGLRDVFGGEISYDPS